MSQIVQIRRDENKPNLPMRASEVYKVLPKVGASNPASKPPSALGSTDPKATASTGVISGLKDTEVRREKNDMLNSYFS